MTRLALLIVGPTEHGVVTLAGQLARDLAEPATLARQPKPQVTRSTRADVLAHATAPAADVVHVHFTDQLFGPSCGAAADAYDALAEAWTGRQGVALSVTLHDLPDPDDEPGRYERRRAAYARVLDRTAGPVIVSSRHEARLLHLVDPGCEPVVIPLAVGGPSNGPGAPVAPAQADRDGDVAILGFIYPGKGHAKALAALAGLPSQVGLTALGRTADGHDALTAQLRAAAELVGRRFTVTGYLPDAALHDHLRRAAVPLAAHDRISASGSIGTWLNAGRRPLVPDGPYIRELAARCDGAVTVYEPSPAGLSRALARAAADPCSTWLSPEVALTPTRADVARAYYAALTTAVVPARG